MDFNQLLDLHFSLLVLSHHILFLCLSLLTFLSSLSCSNILWYLLCLSHLTLSPLLPSLLPLLLHLCRVSGGARSPCAEQRPCGVSAFTTEGCSADRLLCGRKGQFCAKCCPQHIGHFLRKHGRCCLQARRTGESLFLPLPSPPLPSPLSHPIHKQLLRVTLPLLPSSQIRTYLCWKKESAVLLRNLLPRPTQQSHCRLSSPHPTHRGMGRWRERTHHRSKRAE